jgi:ADP-heptose:LPS heptosyltransferase
MIALGTLICLRFTNLFSRRKFILISLFEHIGDIIATEPVVGYLRAGNPNAFIVWSINKSYDELLCVHPGINYILRLNYFYEWIILRNFLKVLCFNNIIDLHLDKKTCTAFNKSIHKPDNMIGFDNYLEHTLLESFSLAAGLPALNNAPHFYIDKTKIIEDLPENYIVFHTHSNIKRKFWQRHKWISLSAVFRKMGYHIYEIGFETQMEGDNHHIDYTGKKSLQKIANLIKDSKFFIGIDSGFAHMANALDTDGLVLIGRFKRGITDTKRYNPFSGKYAHPAHIIYADEDLAAPYHPKLLFKE